MGATVWDFNVALLVWLLYPYQGKAAQFSAKDSMHNSHKTGYPTVSFTVIDKDSVWLTVRRMYRSQTATVSTKKTLGIGAACRSSTMRCSPRSG